MTQLLLGLTHLNLVKPAPAMTPGLTLSLQYTALQKECAKMTDAPAKEIVTRALVDVARRIVELRRGESPEIASAGALEVATESSKKQESVERGHPT
jgi:hypothetical protein